MSEKQVNATHDEMQSASLIELPFEVWLLIISNVTLNDCLALSQVCRGVKNIAECDYVWRRLLSAKAHSLVYASMYWSRPPVVLADQDFQSLQRVSFPECKQRYFLTYINTPQEHEKQSAAIAWLTPRLDNFQTGSCTAKEFKKFDQFAWSGFPKGIRGKSYFHISGGFKAMSTATISYKTYVKTFFSDVSLPVRREYTTMVIRDVKRTFHDHPDFAKMDSPRTCMLVNILYAYHSYDPSFGYCSGLARLVSLLLLVMSEEHAFWTFVCLFNTFKYQMRRFFGPQAETVKHLRKVHKKLITLITCYFPKIRDKPGLLNVGANIGSFKFITCFMDSFKQLSFVFRIWDVFCVCGHPVLYSFFMAIIEANYERLESATDNVEVALCFSMSEGISTDDMLPDTFMKIARSFWMQKRFRDICTHV